MIGNVTYAWGDEEYWNNAFTMSLWASEFLFINSIFDFVVRNSFFW